jgi:O6-methylguanine-DNA--protein-cysteine methyltransferase
MQAINIESTEDTPKVILDVAAGKFEMSGRSLPEDAAEFYQPILHWLDAYSKSSNPETIFEVKLEYFNTASSKLILDVLTKLEDISNSKVHWYYYEDDEDMEEAGEEFSELIEVDFELKEF